MIIFVVQYCFTLYNGTSAMKIVFMGTPAVAIPCLEVLLEAGHEVVGVFCAPSHAGPRSRRLESPSVKITAQHHNLPVWQPASLRDVSVEKTLTALNPETIVVAAYGKLLPRSILNIPRFGCLNIHPSLLPLHRGPAPVVTAILEGDEETGVTIMVLGRGMDSGPILSQEAEKIKDEDTAETLTSRLFSKGSRLLTKTLEEWTSGEIEAEPQDARKATQTRLISKKDGRINWRLTALQISRQVRAYNPWPSAHTHWKGKELKITESQPITEESAKVPGMSREIGCVVGLSRKGAGVVTADGILEIKKVQIEGRRLLQIEEFLMGQRDFLESTLPS
jgi:methionyl-tRNA formyltransferase